MLNLVLAACCALWLAEDSSGASKAAGGGRPATVRIVGRPNAALPETAEPPAEAPPGEPDDTATAASAAPGEEMPAAEEGSIEAGSVEVGGEGAGSEAEPGQAADELSPALAELRTRIRTALAIYYRFPVNSRDHCPWEVMHWVLAYGVDSQIRADGPSGPPQTAVGWLCFNRPCRNQRLLSVQGDRVVPLSGAGLQGHDGQLLAILAQARVPQDYPLRVGNSSLTVADLVESEKLGCTSGSELTFRLIGLAHYLESEARWKNRAGQLWSIPALIREEIQKPIRGAACGGTHRLMGLSYAVRVRKKRGQPIDGEYERAEAYVRSYQRYTLGLQNRDGSFSTAWFERREARQDTARRVQTTGHILEWMVFSLSDEELKDPRIIGAASYLAGTLIEHRDLDWKIGPLGHALRSLALYDRRVFVPLQEQAETLARRPAEPALEPPPVDEPPAAPPEPSPDAPASQAPQPAGSPEEASPEEASPEEAPPAKPPAAENPPAKAARAGRPPASRPASKKRPAGPQAAP